MKYQSSLICSKELDADDFGAGNKVRRILHAVFGMSCGAKAKENFR